MSDLADGKIACPSCRRAYQWDRELAGCTIECPCGRAFEFPFNQPGGQEEVYDLDPSAPARPKLVKETKSATAAPRVVPYRQTRPDAETKQTLGELIAETPMKSIMLPIVLIVGGLLARVIVAMYFPLPAGVWQTYLSLVLTTATNVICMFVGVGIIARWTGSDMGSLPVLVLKLVAIGVIGSLVFASAIALLDTRTIHGPVVALHLVVLVQFFMIAGWIAFDLQESLFAAAVVGLMQFMLACVVLPR